MQDNIFNSFPKWLMAMIFLYWLLAIGYVAYGQCKPPKSDVPFPKIKIEKIVDGLESPVYLTHAGDRSKRLFIVEQAGSIRVLKGGKLLSEPFLDIRDRVVFEGEMGLLSVAFHPNFSKNRRFFVNYTAKLKTKLYSIVSEFHACEDLSAGQKDTERVLLKLSQPFPNHNGGLNLFGPDGYLYIGFGDGGAGNDPYNNAQSLKTLLGKILRIDVDKKTGKLPYGIPDDNPFVKAQGVLPEIWAYGLRNPWRFSFDAATGRLYAADVGQNAREEIDVVEKGKNYGWRFMEGFICTPSISPNCKKEGLELPVIDYPRDQGVCVTGGYVYRGNAIPGLCGAYVYGDFGSGKIWALRYDGKKVTKHGVLLSTEMMISSFGEDEKQELYVVDYRGTLFKFTK